MPGLKFTRKIGVLAFLFCIVHVQVTLTSQYEYGIGKNSKNSKRNIGLENHRLAPNLHFKDLEFRPSQPLPPDTHPPVHFVYPENYQTPNTTTPTSIKSKIRFVSTSSNSNESESEKESQNQNQSKSQSVNLEQRALQHNGESSSASSNFWTGLSSSPFNQHQSASGGPGGSAWRRDGYFHQQNCQQLRSFNPGCCNLGYTNCCGSGGGGVGIFPQPGIGISNGWSPIGHQWKGKGHSSHVRPQFPLPPPPHHHHVQVRPHPIPIPQPHIPKHRPVIPYRPQFGGTHEKPGSCHYKSPFSFLSKLNIFSKDKGIKQGWGWDPFPPSQNAGYHFHRRADTHFSNSGHLNRKRQLDIPAQTNYYNQNRNSNSYSGNSNGKQNDIYNYQSYENFENNKKFRYEGDMTGNKFDSSYTIIDGKSDGGGGIDDDKKYEEMESYQSLNYGNGNYGNYGREPIPVGIGSLTGRVLGGWGWNQGITTGWTVVNPHHPCYTDFECPGNQKCCGGTCKTPSFGTFGR